MVVARCLSILMPRRRPRRRKPPGLLPGPAPDALCPTLDLHGFTADEARRKTDGWLRDRQRDGEATVRVITGRGLHSAGPPVLPGETEALLQSLRGSVVADFASEAGGGAFRVEIQRLRRPVEPRAAAERPSGPRDPELLRRAEEALWELGVQPAPALLRAEMRRLRAEGGEI